MKLRIAVLAVLILTSPASAQLFGSKPPPVDQNDVRAVIEALVPLTEGKTTDVSVFVWADGSLNVKVKTRNGSEIVGRGRKVQDAMQDMARQSTSVLNALKPLLPSQ